jgi:hypothetical protein
MNSGKIGFTIPATMVWFLGAAETSLVLSYNVIELIIEVGNQISHHSLVSSSSVSFDRRG